MARRRRRNPSGGSIVGSGFLGALLGYGAFQMVKPQISADPQNTAATQAKYDMQRREEIGAALAGAAIGMAAGSKLLP